MEVNVHEKFTLKKIRLLQNTSVTDHKCVPHSPLATANYQQLYC